MSKFPLVIVSLDDAVGTNVPPTTTLPFVSTVSAVTVDVANVDGDEVAR